MDLKELHQSGNNRHPWEISRAASILKMVRSMSYDSIADIGSGDMYFTREAQKETQKHLYACDINYTEDDLKVSDDGIEVVSSLSDIPATAIDLVFLLDVLEHVEDEDNILQGIRERLSEKGRLVVTVPAHQFLFSDHDVFLQHCRRYNRKGLRTVLEKNDFVIERVFYFYSSLFVAKLLMKLFASIGIKPKYKNSVSNWGYNESHFITRNIVSFLNFDFTLTNFLNSAVRLNIPGLSLCAIVKKSV